MDSRQSRPWWMLFPREERMASEPDPAIERPSIVPGSKVRLKDKPERVRTVLAVEWHSYRHCYCFRVETSKTDAGMWEPSYWFAEQLEVVEDA